MSELPLDAPDFVQISRTGYLPSTAQQGACSTPPAPRA